MACLITPNVMVTFPEKQTGGPNVLNLCLSGNLGDKPIVIKDGADLFVGDQVGIVRGTPPPK